MRKTSGLAQPHHKIQALGNPRRSSAPPATIPITPLTRYHIVLPVKRPVSASDICSTGSVKGTEINTLALDFGDDRGRKIPVKSALARRARRPGTQYSIFP
jgi:hypothetical protein